MSQLALCILFTALFVNGLHIATQQNMILHFVKRWLDSIFIKQSLAANAPKVSKLYYPLLYCIKCMPSVYGAIICLVFLPFGWHLLISIPVVVICSVTLSTILHSQYL